MKLKIFILLCIFFVGTAFPQAVKGKILSESNNIQIVKVWGTHQERGYAQGYLMADKIETILKNYVKWRVPAYYYSLARTLLQSTTPPLKFDPKYIEEAKAMIQGMKAAGSTVSADYLDVLIANSFLDILGFIPAQKSENSDYGCSSLMSWGAATQETFLQGKSIITRNLDWETDTTLCANQVIVFHQPSETYEQPWAMIGFAGQIGVLSGTNKSGLSIFQHVLRVYEGPASLNMQYEPIWMTLRKALESADYNNDGVNNTADMQAAINSNPQGYAASCIISALAPSANAGQDSLIALVAEVTHTQPMITFRGNEFNDSIPSSNLYAANTPVKRANARTFEPRYVSVINAIGDGLLIDSSKSWVIMRDSSRVVDGNIQMIQVIPEMKLLRMSVYRDKQCAYSNQPVTYNLETLFAIENDIATGITINGNSFSKPAAYQLLQNYPNPFNPSTVIRFGLPENAQIRLTVYNQIGQQVAELVNGQMNAGFHQVTWNAANTSSGVYFYEIKTDKFRSVKKLLLMK